MFLSRPFTRALSSNSTRSIYREACNSELLQATIALTGTIGCSFGMIQSFKEMTKNDYLYSEKEKKSDFYNMGQTISYGMIGILISPVLVPGSVFYFAGAKVGELL